MSERDRDKIDEIKYQCDLIALCKELGLKRKLGAKTFSCPRGENHSQGDTHGSFVVYPLIRAFECLVCKDDPLSKMKGGWKRDCFRLVVYMKKLSFSEAVSYVDQFNKKLEKDRTERGFDDYATERSEFLHNSADTSMYAPMYSLIWGLGKSAVEIPDIVGRFEHLGISKNTMYQYNIVYLSDVEKVMGRLKDKYSNSESLIKAGILTYDGRLKFENYRVLIPYFEDDVITALQGWDLSEDKPVFINPKNDLPSLLNANKLKYLNSGSTVIFTEDAIECMSATELFGDSSVLPVAPGTRKINNEWLEFCQGMKVKTMMKDNEKAEEIARAFETIKHRQIEIVDLAKEGGVSINAILRDKKKIA